MKRHLSVQLAVKAGNLNAAYDAIILADVEKDLIVLVELNQVLVRGDFLGHDRQGHRLEQDRGAEGRQLLERPGQLHFRPNASTSSSLAVPQVATWPGPTSAPGALWTCTRAPSGVVGPVSASALPLTCIPFCQAAVALPVTASVLIPAFQYTVSEKSVRWPSGRFEGNTLANSRTVSVLPNVRLPGIALTCALPRPSSASTGDRINRISPTRSGFMLIPSLT